MERAILNKLVIDPDEVLRRVKERIAREKPDEPPKL